MSEYKTRREKLLESRRKRTQEAIEKRKKENEKRKQQIGGSARAYHKNKSKGDTVEKTKSTTKMTGKERAQAMAKKRIASGKTIAEIKAANKLKIKKRAAEKYAAFKKKKKK